MSLGTFLLFNFWNSLKRINIYYSLNPTPLLWPPDAKSWLIWKDPDAGKDWGQEKKGTTDDEMVGWHHWLNVHEFGWTPGVGEGQGGLACCGSWGRKESDMTERLNWTDSCFTVLCYILLYSKVNQLCIYIYPLPFGFLSHLGHHRPLSPLR